MVTNHRQSATGTCNIEYKTTTILHDAREFFASFLFTNTYMQPIGIGQSSKTFEPTITNDHQNGSANVNDELAGGPKTNGDAKPWESVNDDLAMFSSSSEFQVQGWQKLRATSHEFRVQSQYSQYTNHTTINNSPSKPPGNDRVRAGSLSFLNDFIKPFFKRFFPFYFPEENLQPVFINSKNVFRTKIFSSILLVGILCFGFSQKINAQGPGAAWTSSTAITLTPATPASNFQVKIRLNAGQYANMKSDGSDLRFYDNSNNNCEYWLETWNLSGASIIWVKVPASGTNTLTMYYGNAAATAVSNGNNVFDFFDDFTGASLAGNWQQSVSNNSTVSVSAGNAILTCNTPTPPNPVGSAGISSPFIPASGAFVLEAKHNEPNYNRNRFYAATTVFGNNPFGFDDGYFSTSGTASGTAEVFWNGVFQAPITANTDYLSQWQITDGASNPYTWSTFSYPAMELVQTNTNANTSTPVRFITISVTEVPGTSTKVDWVRVRKLAASEPVAVVYISPTTISSTSSFKIPAGVTSITVQAWGGGGKGSSGSSDGGYGGGGGGAYARSILPVSTGNTYDVIVGTGSNTTAAGGNSSFRLQPSGPNLVLAVGGNSLNNNTTAGATGGASGSSVGNDFVSSGGRGGNGNTSGGGGGSSGGTAANGIYTSSTTTATGGTVAGGGAGGSGSTSDDIPGSHGFIPGGGGGGARRNNNTIAGGNGVDGQVTIAWTVNCPTITISTSKTNLNCFQDGSGQIIINASGGTTPYTYSIFNGVAHAPFAAYQSGNTFTGLPAGTYQIRVKDAIGCESKSVQ